MAPHFDFINIEVPAQGALFRFLHPLQEATIVKAVLAVQEGIRSLIQANRAFLAALNAVVLVRP